MQNATNPSVKKLNVPATIALFLALERKEGEDSGIEKIPLYITFSIRIIILNFEIELYYYLKNVPTESFSYLMVNWPEYLRIGFERGLIFPVPSFSKYRLGSDRNQKS